MSGTNTTPINDGGPAFPFGQVSELTGQPINGFFASGMTLRDYFAGQALTNLLPALRDDALTPDEVASDAYRFADAMLVAREAKR